MSVKVIPLSSLVILVGPSGAGKSTFCTKNFDVGEVVSTDAIRRELMGDHRRMDHFDDVFTEYYRRIEWRLARGFRAVADATHLRDSDRLRVAEIGNKYGVKTIYVVINRSIAAKNSSAGWRASVRTRGMSLIEAHDQTFVANEKKILSGDAGNNRAKVDYVIDTRTDEYKVINKMTRDPKMVISELLNRGFRKIRLVGDIHGNVDGLNAATSVDDDTFVQFLGDIPDYGKRSLEACNMVADMVSYGRAGNLQGNHERKVGRFVLKERARIDNLLSDGTNHPDFPGFVGSASFGNDVTFDQVKAMVDPNRYHWEVKFLGLIENSPDHIVIEANNITYGFVHGAMHPRLFENTMFRLPEQTMEWKMAMFGQTVDGQKDSHGYPIRIYDWVEQIPSRHTVVVGHDIRSTENPVIMTSSSGGRVVFLDTGSSKDGKLSWLDLEIVQRKNKFDLIESDFGFF